MRKLNGYPVTIADGSLKWFQWNEKKINKKNEGSSKNSSDKSPDDLLEDLPDDLPDYPPDELPDDSSDQYNASFEILKSKSFELKLPNQSTNGISVIGTLQISKNAFHWRIQCIQYMAFNTMNINKPKVADRFSIAKQLASQLYSQPYEFVESCDIKRWLLNLNN